MREEELIRAKFGKKECFRVPEGFFDDFADQLMDQLPVAEPAPAAEPDLAAASQPVVCSPKSQYHLLRFWLPYAAVLCALSIGLGWMFVHSNGDELESVSSSAVAVQETLPDEMDNLDRGYMNEILDYALVDNSEIAMYLTE